MKLKFFIVAASFLSCYVNAQLMSGKDFESVLMDKKLLTVNSSPLADIKLGEQIANKGCIACHGDAMLKMMPTYPSLSGQKPVYLFKQLVDFKSGVRNNPLMQSQAVMLSERDMKSVSLYFASKKPINFSN